ncbi:SDR family NAD(P)-dependent oxidoreductase [Streptomyces sp. NPDC056580]|uniref:SDR family NAD(P)-dependent oxidoreductase n=1 Tax=Streptomyces sp. NPDC056580 TaxID=3345872 RepID=UPI0036788FE4
MIETTTFTETLTVTADNPLLHGHVVYGRSLLPGVGYVDLVLQVLARHGHPMPEVELRDLAILAPLVAGPGERVLTTVAGRPGANGGWRVEVRSRRAEDTVEVLHAVANVRRRPRVAFGERLALPVEGATRRTTLDEIYTWCREYDLHHSGLMKLGGVVHHRTGDWVAEVELAPEHQASAAGFLFHPALFEAGLLGGGVALGMLHGDNDGPGLYLPLMFERFRAAGPLGGRCYVRVPADSVRRDEELIRLVVEFYDAEGAKVAEVGRFVAKRIRAAASLDVRGDAPAPAGPAPAVPSAASPGGGAGVVDVVRGAVAARLGVAADGVDVGSGYYELGLASADLLSLVAELEERLSVELSPTVMFEYRTIAELAQWLETQVPAGAPAAWAAPPAPAVAAPVAAAPVASVPGADARAESLPAASVPAAPASATPLAAAPASPAPAPEAPAPAGTLAPAGHGLPSAPATGVVASGGAAGPDALGGVRAALTGEVAALLGVDAADVHADAELAEFGLDVTGLARLADRVGARLGLPLDPGVLREHRTLNALAAHLTGEHRTPPEAAPVPHALLHGSVGEGAGDTTTYETRFSGDEPFLRDHRVHGDRILPGVAHLEMARVAVARALGQDDAAAVRLTDVVWLRPAVCGPGGLTLRVRVRTSAAGGCAYEIESVGDHGETTLCGQGRAALGPDGTGAGRTRLLDRLRAACADTFHTAEGLYGLYDRMGMAYGPSQRSVTGLRTGTDAEGRPQVLAELRLPAEAEPLGAGALMHPSILDGALQATIGLWLDQGAGTRSAGLALPFALDRAEPVAATTATAHAWIRHRPGPAADGGTARLDVTVLDEHGRVCVELTGLSTRLLPDPAAARTTPGAVTTTPDPAAARTTPGAVTTTPDPAPVRDGDIAIIGVSGRYPEAADLDEFWQNLRAGRDCVREIPADRWDRQRYADAGAGSWGGFLDDIDRFDPLFFQISLLEADHLDPQERLFLQCAHHTLEDAGYTAERLSRGGRVGVYVGVMYQEYQLLGAQAQERGRPDALWGSASTVANRVSYFYDFRGPSLAVDTMCSSSLTSIHLACEAIRSGQCDTALAGGVNLTPHPNKYLVLGRRDFLSSDGRCRSFGEGGDGYVPGEGVGAVLLKPLARAVADGDRIHGVVKATAVNHGGRTSGYSVPTPVAQGEVIADALTAAGVDPGALGYLEAHGTGTSLGDPIEVAGLQRAFARAGGAPRRLAIGSVKSNIGHCESAAGIAGVTKVLLQMRHGELVPSLHSANLNPHIDFDRTPLRVQRSLEPWHRPVRDTDGERRTLPRLAGVSSFGGGGSNAHVVIEEYPEPVRPRTTQEGPYLLVLSARTEEQLAEQARLLHARLGELTDADLPAVAWTLQTGRTALDQRLALAVGSITEARDRLAAFAAAPAAPGPWARGAVRPDRPADAAAVGAAVAAWREQGTYEALLALWAEGGDVDWDLAARPGPRPHRIGLPGYPFARERCWFGLDTEGAPQRSAVGDEGDGADEGDVVLLRPRWTEAPAAGTAAPGETFAERHVVLVGPVTAGDREALTAALPAGTHCTVVEPADGPVHLRYTEAARQVFTLTRDLLRRGVRRPTLLQVAAVGGAGDGTAACLGGLAGLLRTAHLENPRLRTQYVECLDGASPAALAARLTAEAVAGPEPEVRHRDGRRLVRRPAEVPLRPAPTPWREGGLYLVTGGAGGLGLVVARDIAAAVGTATVVLIGRSPLTGAQRAGLDALRAAGLTVDHRRADVADRDALACLLAQVTDEHGPLTGVLHSAGVVHDNFLVRKSAEELDRVLAPKVAGLVHLDELTREQPLELFVCFSSIAGAFGNPGQADYAAANAFMDAYAVHRNRLVGAGLRAGRTVSVGWPLWDEGGMGAGDTVRDQLRAAGLVPLDTPRGLAALRFALADQDVREDGGLLVVAGDRTALSATLLPSTAPADAGRPDRATDAPGSGTGTDAPGSGTGTDAPGSDPAAPAVEERAVAHLRRVLAAALKLGPERLDADTPLERYGMDSVLAVTMLQPLEETFGPLSRTLLFEVRTVRGLARYLAADHPRALRTLVGAPAPAPASGSATAPAEAVAPRPPRAPAPAAAPARRGSGRSDDGIAVIGISGRYPHAGDLEEFWSVLREGRDCVTEVPADRWDSGGRAEWGAFLDGVDRFDPLHFGIAPSEAAAMDPQQRLFLETVWHLLEQGGVTQEVVERRHRRQVGVYVGAAYQMYRADPAADPALAALTASASYNLIANRVSNFFGLEGPSLAVDSMCTSSAMAVHLACADLLRGECELAVAGGVNLNVHPDKYRALGEMRLLGTHPGARSFRDGDGYLPAEAVGAVLLKPLDAALRDGDTVHAVIRSTASLHGGRSNGFMTPSHRTQVATMRRALERAGTAPADIGCVEAAANGTAFSDEVEVRALREVFAGVTEPVPVGSVKSNLGHPEAASGIAQLTKVVLQLRHGRIAPLVATGTANPRLDLEGSPLRLAEEPAGWEPRGDAPRRALINSVAAGGSHVSIVVEAPPAAARTVPADPAPQVVLVSARTPELLRTAVGRLHDFLGGDEGDGTVSLADIAYTSQLGREPQAERLAVVAADRGQLREALAAELAEAPATPAVRAGVHRGNAEGDAGPLAAVLTGARGEEFLAGLVQDRALEQLAELWAHGVRVPWAGLHDGPRPMAPLPPTAFETGRYWVGRAPEQPAATRRTAPEPPGPQAPAAADTPSHSLRTMTLAWADVLGVDPERLDGRSDFFALGGNSLLATRLINRLTERAGVELPVEAVFSAPRLADMALELGRRAAGTTDAGSLDVDLILESIALVEHMSDEELDALDIES